VTRIGTLPLDSNPTAHLRRSRWLGQELTGVAVTSVRQRGSTERKQRSTAMTQNGGGCSTPPPGTGGVSNGGRTRWRLPLPVPRQRSVRRRTRANGEKGCCLGGCWERCEFNWVIGGGFYRPEGRGLGRPVARRRGGPGDAR
jgi:hypothetical protein